jgi:hypothetical protein
MLQVSPMRTCLLGKPGEEEYWKTLMCYKKLAPEAACLPVAPTCLHRYSLRHLFLLLLLRLQSSAHRLGGAQLDRIAPEMLGP